MTRKGIEISKSGRHRIIRTTAQDLSRSTKFTLETLIGGVWVPFPVEPLNALCDARVAMMKLEGVTA